MTENSLTKNSWAELKQHTAARIALGRAGAGLPTDAYLDFKLSHAQARDAVWLPLDADELTTGLEAEGLESICVESRVPDKQTYLTRPDLGRALSETSVQKLRQADMPAADVLLVIADGLSSIAIRRHAIPFLRTFLPYMQAQQKTVAPVVIATHARVALGDEIGERCRARMVVMLIGERPGLTSPDSMGIYLTWNPRVGECPDSARNCISNVRPEGLPYQKAAYKLAWLVEHAFHLNCTGILLKDNSDPESDALIDAPVAHLTSKQD